MIKKFNELFGIKETIENEKIRFVQRINMTIFNEYNNIANATQRSLESDNVKIKNDGMKRINDFVSKSIAEAKFSKGQ